MYSRWISSSLILVLVSLLPVSAGYQNLTALETTNQSLKLQIHSSSTSVNLDSDPELRFRVRLPRSVRGSIRVKIYKNASGERGRLISMRKPSIPSKAKTLVVDMPLNQVKDLSEIIIDICNSAGTVINTYTATISSTSTTADEDDVLGGVESASVSTGVFVKESGNVYVDGLESTDHFIFGSNQIDNATGTDDDSKLMFLRGSKDGAFRAGRVTGTAWDQSNIGAVSVALGTDVKASGSYSLSLGSDNESTAQGSITIGTNARATQTQSIAIGNNVSSTHPYATVIGSGNSAEDPLVSTEEFSMSIGFNSNAATLFVSPSAGGSTTGRVGVGTSSPSSAVKLDVAGPLRIREQGSLPTCNSAAKGMIIYYSNNFRGCNGSGWQYLN